jgi:hypothetical protein
MNKKEVRYAFKIVLQAADNARCEGLHHTPKHRHESGEVCKAEYAINKQTHILREYMKELGL